MKTAIVLSIGLVFLSLSSIGQTLVDLNIDYMLRGSIYAGTSITDSTALGGFGRSNNAPKKMDESKSFSESGLFLKIDTSELVSIYSKFNAYKFYIGNNSDSTIALLASDSRLYVVAEVYYKNQWHPIEYVPSSWCGNSYHRVYLRQKEYWEFVVPKFSGKIKTKLRYSLKVHTMLYIYSNEIDASFNLEQLTEKRDYQPSGLMDPYND